MLSMDTVFGIPAHPLLVHIPTVLLPLAALGVVIMVIKPAWHHRYRWAVLFLGFVGMVGAILAADAGESLAERVEATQGGQAARTWQDHVEAGDTARLFAFIFFVLLAAYVLVPWFARRRASADKPLSMPKFVAPLLAVLVLAGAAGSVITIVLAGHSGAKAVWCQTMTPPNCDG